MSTVVELSEHEIAELKAATNQDDAASAIRMAAAEYLRYVKRMRLKELSGNVQMEDNWKALEDAELRERRGQ